MHLAEFHYEDGSHIPEADRLHKPEVMHGETRRLSDHKLLVLPGEEPNVHLGGHWISLFPKPVHWTLNRPEGKPFVEEIDGHGRVYHVGSPVTPRLEASLEWTFPLAFAEVISGDGQQVFRQRVDLADTESFEYAQASSPARSQRALVGAL